jgi:hypothetical protein
MASCPPVNLSVVVIHDAKGDHCYGVCEDSGTTIQLNGLDAKGNRQHFESEAYHVAAWCNEHGFGMETHQITLDVQTHKVTSWDASVVEPEPADPSPPRKRTESPIQYYDRTGVVDDNFQRQHKGRYYCNPAHCRRSWTDKDARDRHLSIAYAALR